MKEKYGYDFLINFYVKKEIILNVVYMYVIVIIKFLIILKILKKYKIVN